MARIIDGKAISAEIRTEIRKETEAFFAKTGIQPGLAVILAGENPASQIYVRNKEKACAEVGFLSKRYVLPATVSEEELLDLIDRLNVDPTIHGILLQLPLPEGLDERRLLLRIAPEKDVDAFHPFNVGEMMIGYPTFLPCTPAGIMALLSRCGIAIAGRECVVVGRSNIVGKPMAMLLLQESGTVTVCHSKTKDLAEHTRRADILVVAVGRAGLITGDMLKPGAVVIDVGMNRGADGKLCGDVDFASAEPIASAITPVPGGVGPMTITMLLQNTLRAAKNAAEQ